MSLPDGARANGVYRTETLGRQSPWRLTRLALRVTLGVDMATLPFTKSVRSLNRIRQIAQVLTGHGFGHIVARIDLGRFVPVWMIKRKQASADELAASSVGRRLTMVCNELGPTFVKLGQMLSTRPDILPEEVVAELQSLQDAVPPFDTGDAMAVIAEQLGKPVDQCFKSIEQDPLASASIGQVYRAVGFDDEQLVVKVRRPDIEETIRLDMQLLQWLAESLESLIPETRIYRPAAIVSELEQTLLRELDYVNEASATERFGKAFFDDAGIAIPKVYWELTGPGVLTLGAISGEKLGAILQGTETTNQIDKKIVAKRLVDAYLKQIFELGMFHADPHPGNILVAPPGRVGLIDFGQVGTITDEWMTELIVIVYASVTREVDMIIEALADMDAVKPETDRRSLHRAMTQLLDKYYGLPIKRFDLTTLFAEFSDVIRRHDMVVPRDMVMLIKAFSTVASVTTKLDPDLNLLELLKPRLARAFRDRISPGAFARGTALAGWHLLSIARQAPTQLRQLMRRLSTGGWRIDVHHKNIDRLIRELDRSSNRLAFSVVIAAIIVGSSVVVSAATELTILGIKVQYLGLVGYLLAGILGLGLTWAILRSGRLH